MIDNEFPIKMKAFFRYSNDDIIKKGGYNKNIGLSNEFKS